MIWPCRARLSQSIAHHTCNVKRGIRDRPWREPGHLPLYNETHGVDYIARRGGEQFREADMRNIRDIPITPSEQDTFRNSRPGQSASNRLQKRPRSQSTKYIWRDWQDNLTGHVGEVPHKNVLVLRGLNKHLTEQDFVRAFLEGTHFKQYVQRIIPLRNEHTLERIDSYLVIFDSPLSLQKHRRHLERLVGISTKFTMTSLMHSKIPPQEGFSVHGQKFDKLVKSFALVPAGSTIPSNCYDSLPPKLSRIIRYGGYRDLVETDGKRRPAVLLKVLGIRDMTAGDVLQAILHDGEVRNMHWDIIHEHSDLHHNIHPEITRMVSAQTQRDQIVQTYPGHMLETNMSMPAIAAIVGPNADASAPAQIANKAYDGLRWLVYFESQRNASQFARAWHCRPFPLPSVQDKRYLFAEEARKVQESDGGKRTKVMAELMW